MTSHVFYMYMYMYIRMFMYTTDLFTLYDPLSLIPLFISLSSSSLAFLLLTLLALPPLTFPQGKLAVQLEQQLTNPHQFEPYELEPNHHKECAFCKYQIHPDNVACKCKVCGSICHDDCKTRMPYNCGQESFTLKRRASKEVS